jgi:uncharacterized protein YdhG (YjbR/CyaY superfamily)
MLRSGAVIAAWFDTLRPEQRDTAQRLRDVVIEAEPALEPTIKWGNLVFSHAGSHALAIVVHKDHANLQVFNGTRLYERFPMLEGTGKGLRHLKQRYRTPVDAELVTALAHASVDELKLLSAAR